MGLRKTIFGRQKLKANTFIGGVASTLNTPALIASKIGLNASRIKNFKIIGNDIQFTVTGGNYDIAAFAFAKNTDITYYDDRDGLVTSLLTQSFRWCSAITLLNFPGVTSIVNYALEGLTSLQIGNFQSCVNFSATYTFLDVPQTCIITTNVAALTNGVYGGPTSGLVAANCIVNYIGYTDDGTWNTEIKGVAAIDNSRLLIGRRLGCSPAALLNFQIVGSDIRFKVYGRYVLKSSFNNRSDITAFNDYDNLVYGFQQAFSIIAYCPNITSLTFNGVIRSNNNGSAFRNNISMTSLTMNNMIDCTSEWFCRNCADNFVFNFANLVSLTGRLTYGNNVIGFYSPKLKYLGASASTADVFDNNIKLNSATITVDRFMQTSNAETEEADLAYARNSRGATIVYIDN